MSVHQTDDGRWYVKYPKGKNPAEPNRTKEYFGRGIDAENKARRRNTELGLGTRSPGCGKTFSDLAIDYLQTKADRIEDSSVATAHTHIQAHLDPFFADIDITAIDEQLLDAYVSHRRRQPWKAGGGRGEVKIGVSRSTIRRELATLQAVLNLAVRRKAIIHNPVMHYEAPKEDDAVISPPTEAELSAILREAQPHLRRFITLAWFTACRPGFSELLTMRWDQIDFAGQTIFIRSAKKGGLDARRIHMHPDLEQHLITWYNEDQAMNPMPSVIVHYCGRPVKKIDRAWAAAKKRAKVLRRLRPYDIRHASITSMLELGASLKATSLIAGHSSPAMTMRKYQHVSSTLQETAINSLGTIGTIGREGENGKGNTGA